MGGDGAVLADELARAWVAGARADSVVLVEGVSDQLAIETLARRRGRNLAAEGVTVVPTAGATNIDRFLAVLGPHGYDVPLAGLCDQGEEPELRRALERAGLGPGLDRAALERLGFFVCVADLEDELVRALGAPAMLDLIAGQGHTRRFRTFRNQPAQRGKPIEAQLHRWLGNHKIRYAPVMVAALDLDAVPRPLDGLLDSF